MTMSTFSWVLLENAKDSSLYSPKAGPIEKRDRRTDGHTDGRTDEQTSDFGGRLHKWPQRAKNAKTHEKHCKVLRKITNKGYFQGERGYFDLDTDVFENDLRHYLYACYDTRNLCKIIDLIFFTDLVFPIIKRYMVQEFSSQSKTRLHLQLENQNQINYFCKVLRCHNKHTDSV